jgi:hypothetical protein
LKVDAPQQVLTARKTPVTLIVYPATSAQGRCLKIEQVICVGTRVRATVKGAKLRVTKRPANAKQLAKSGSLGSRFSVQNFELKSLILAQIERWRRA